MILEEKEILEGNKIIVKFMGFSERKPDEEFETVWFKKGGFNQYGINQLKYHLSWDWLMPVIEKIESVWVGHTQPRVMIEGTYCQIADSGGYFAKNSKLNKDNQLGGECYPNKYTKIENTYRMVIKFIEWHNNYLKTN